MLSALSEGYRAGDITPRTSDRTESVTARRQPSCRRSTRRVGWPSRVASSRCGSGHRRNCEPKLHDKSLTLGEYAETWWAERALKPTTRAHYRYVLDRDLIPAFGDTELQGITPEAVRTW